MNFIRMMKICLNETRSEVRIDKQLSDNFPIQNGLHNWSDVVWNTQKDVLKNVMCNMTFYVNSIFVINVDIELTAI
jgi:hypothetical protein